MIEKLAGLFAVPVLRSSVNVMASIRPWEREYLPQNQHSAVIQTIWQMGEMKRGMEVNNVEQQGAVALLEYLAKRAGLQYLSDLHYLSRQEQCHLSREISRIPAEAFLTAEWNDALDYLTGLPPEPSAPDAREALLQHLAEPSHAF